MPFQSQAQQRFMFANHPDIAKRWAAVTPDIKALPQHVQSNSRSKPVSAFSQLASKLAAQGVRNPGAVAYTAGAKKYGAATMHEAAAKKESVKSVLRQRRGR